MRSSVSRSSSCGGTSTCRSAASPSAATSSALLIDDGRQTYYPLDPGSAKNVASQVAGPKQGLHQGLESLTPEQRAAVQELLGVAEVCLADYAKPPITSEAFAAIPALRYSSRRAVAASCSRSQRCGAW